MSDQEYQHRMVQWSNSLTESGLILHGRPEWEQRTMRLQNGIPYTHQIRQALVDLGNSLDLPAPDEI
jgi:LDH2 family malate/lactate/ureidoglycolate dehydrogenase